MIETQAIPHSIKAGSFEGPLPLLLELIESRKLFINEISLASVTEDYITYLRTMGASLEQKSLFVVIAATLLLIKSRSLLPGFQLTDEEEKDISTLELRLSLLQSIHTATPGIASMYLQKSIYFPEERMFDDVVFAPSKNTALSELSLALKDLLVHLPEESVPLPEVSVAKTINIEEVVEQLIARVQESMKVSFTELSRNFGAGLPEKENRIFVIVSFLAMLELVRGGIIDASQEENFNDITIENNRTTE